MGSNSCGVVRSRRARRGEVLVYSGRVVDGETVASGKSSGENSRRRVIMNT